MKTPSATKLINSFQVFKKVEITIDNLRGGNVLTKIEDKKKLKFLNFLNLLRAK